ncbi:hypothetical protein PR003_g28457 [Phytophthora rubi]|uniref:Uncharacterized protein n=1 Tax=Phytophthora rubi TaxID=129364 RepID=A0A6A3I3Y0_9STRA|nr:hypothetical protein PR001_g25877 [Phytophthora rubi]KAE9278667.1 hypothetical protein PR003_g28457 [Phytophthora rubi]
MTTTSTKNRTGKTRRVTKKTKTPPPRVDESTEDDKHDEPGQQLQRKQAATLGHTVTADQQGDQRGSRVTAHEAEAATTGAPVNENEQSSTQAVETETSSTSGNTATMNAAEVAASIQHLMTAAGLQAGATTTGSERSRKKPTAKARRRPGADDEEDERTSQVNRQRVTTRDTPATAARTAQPRQRRTRQQVEVR